MKLPNLDKAVVEKKKVTDYLLALDHPEGSSKAEFFTRFGFGIADWQVLAQALLEHAQSNEVASIAPSAFGAKYRVDGPLLCPDGRSPSVRAVWIVDANSDVPRLVTAHPL